MDQAIRDLFPAARKFTYLNSAAMAPLPTVSSEAVALQLNDVACNGSANLCDWLETKRLVRSMVADMLGARPGDIAFTRNTSDGLCAVASGIDWVAGDNIVTIANEFPANSYPWQKVRDENGVEIRTCSAANGRVDTDELCGMVDGNTRLVAVSAIQYSTGFKLDLERIGKIAGKRDALFAVDIIQAFGAVPFDVSSQHIDIAAGASYKWLCAPEGCGVFYLNERARERIKPRSRGWMSVERPWDFDASEQPLLTDARAWETGMGGSALFYGLEQSLRLLLGAGIEKIERYLAELTDFLCEIIAGRKYRIVSSRAIGEKSQIVSIEPENGLTADQVVARLIQENVVVSSRGGMVRIAPHFFNNFADIESLAMCLP